MTQSHGFVNIQGRGTIALPAVLRRTHHLDQPGAQVEVIERSDGVIELQPHLPVAAREAWARYETQAVPNASETRDKPKKAKKNK
ncbi:MAG: hypothetical protein JO147_03575 [Actinobacteria bacterium]|nr:hypothetical protein [Actinomycetota bacterium]